MQPLFPGQTRTSTLMLFFHVQTAMWARLNLGSTRNRAKIWDAPHQRTIFISSLGDLRFPSPMPGCAANAWSTELVPLSVPWLWAEVHPTGCGPDRKMPGVCAQSLFGATNHNNCTFHMMLPTRVLSRFSWVGCPQVRPQLEPSLSPRAAVRECRSTLEPPPLPAPLQSLCPMSPVTARFLPSYATLIGVLDQGRWRLRGSGPLIRPSGHSSSFEVVQAVLRRVPASCIRRVMYSRCGRPCLSNGPFRITLPSHRSARR